MSIFLMVTDLSLSTYPAVYDVLESNVEHEDDDYSDDTQLQSFAKSTFQVQIKVKKIKKIVNFI